MTDPRSPNLTIDDPATPEVELSGASVVVDASARTFRVFGTLNDGTGGPQSFDQTFPFAAADPAAVESAVGAGTAQYELVMGQPPALRIKDAAGAVIAEVATGDGGSGGPQHLTQEQAFKLAAGIPRSCTPTVTEIPETGGRREVYGWTEPRQEPGQVDTLSFTIELNSAGGVMSVAHLRTFPTS